MLYFDIVDNNLIDRYTSVNNTRSITIPYYTMASMDGWKERIVVRSWPYRIRWVRLRLDANQFIIFWIENVTCFLIAFTFCLKMESNRSAGKGNIDQISSLGLSRRCNGVVDWDYLNVMPQNWHESALQEWPSMDLILFSFTLRNNFGKNFERASMQDKRMEKRHKFTDQT